MKHFFRSLREFPALLNVGAASMVAYRAEMVLWILSATLPLIMLAVWDRVAMDGPVRGFDQGKFALYFAATLIVRQLSGAWVVWELNHQIRTGGLSSALLRPVFPGLWFAAENLAAIPIRLVILVPIVLLIWWWRPELASNFDAIYVPIALISTLFAWLGNFCIQWLFGSFAFWLGQTLGLYNLWFGIWALFSGYLIPFAVMPESMADVARWLPFRALLGTPVDVFSNRLPWSNVVFELGLQLFWVTTLGLLASFVWRMGLRRYEAFGS
ncbi:MAG: ABC-2 family transporter protein [Myxococcales bacterium]|nr:ABC-2 family transporter protein [Myxococcales bacterium]